MPEEQSIFISSFARECEFLNLRYSQYLLQFSKSDSKKEIKDTEYEITEKVIDELKICIIQTFSRFKALRKQAKIDDKQLQKIKEMHNSILKASAVPFEAVQDYVDEINEFYASRVNQNLVKELAGTVTDFAGKNKDD